MNVLGTKASLDMGSDDVGRDARPSDLGRQFKPERSSDRRGQPFRFGCGSATLCKSVNYLLDTNACIAILNGRPIAVREKVTWAIGRKNTIYVSTVVAFELWYGVAKSARRPANEDRLEAFFPALSSFCRLTRTMLGPQA